MPLIFALRRHIVAHGCTAVVVAVNNVAAVRKAVYRPVSGYYGLVGASVVYCENLIFKAVYGFSLRVEHADKRHGTVVIDGYKY